MFIKADLRSLDLPEFEFFVEVLNRCFGPEELTGGESKVAKPSSFLLHGICAAAVAARILSGEPPD